MDHMMSLLVVSLCTLFVGALGEYPYMFAAVPLHAPVPVLRVLTRAPPPPRPLAAAASSRYGDGGAVADPLRHFAEPPRHYASEPPRQYAAVDPLRHHLADPLRQYASEPSRPYAVGTPPPPLRHFAEPPTRHYGGTDSEYETPQYSYSYSRPPYYAPPPPEEAEEVVLYTQGQRGEASGEAGAVLYARLSPTGGYTYRRRAPAVRGAASDHHLRKAPAPTAVPTPAHIKDKDPQYILKIHKYRIIKD